MKRTLVNHSGVIQWKFLISNDEELMQYAKHKSIAIGEEFRQMIQKDYKQSDKPYTNTQKAIKIISRSEGLSLVGSCDALLHKVIMSMHKMVLQGEKLVVNQAGGYCPWDDSCMSVAEETQVNIDIANGKEPQNQIMVNLSDGPFIVLENQYDIPEKVKDYIHLTLGVKKYSYIKNIQFDKEKLPELIKEALFKKHDTFIIQTTLLDFVQVEMMAKLMENFPHRVSFLINAPEDLKNNLTNLIGAKRTEELYKKHKIIQW